MSYFDPHQLYYRSNRKTHKGQIIQKRFVDHDNAFSKEDLDRSFRVLTAYGYSFSRQPLNNPICKTLSFSTGGSFGNGLTMSEIFNSAFRNLILDLDPSFLDLDPNDVKHFYISFSLSTIIGTVQSNFLTIALVDGTQSTVQFSVTTNSYFSISSNADNQLIIIHSPMQGNSEVDYVTKETTGNYSIVNIAFDDTDYYSMLYNNDYSLLDDQNIAGLSSLGLNSVFYTLDISITYVNFD